MSHNLKSSIGLEHLMKAASALTELTDGDDSKSSSSIRGKQQLQQQEERVPISDDDTASATTASLAPSTAFTSNSTTTSSSSNMSSANSTVATASKPASANAPLTANSRDIFPQRLMRILSDKDIQHIITWLPHGRAFVITEPEELAEKVLPKHFPESCTSGNQTCKYPSFTRKLNRWGFRQVTRGPDAGAFHHGLFLRDAPQLCLQMICQRTRRRNDNKNHVSYQEQQQQQQQQQQHQLQAQYGSHSLVHDTFVPSMNNPTLLNNAVNHVPVNNSIHNHMNSSNTSNSTSTSNTTTNTATAAATATSNMTNNQQHHQQQQFFPMNHGGPMSFPQFQGFTHHPIYGALPNGMAASATTVATNPSVTDASHSGSIVHGNHVNPTGMNPPPLGLSTLSFHPTQNHSLQQQPQHLPHLHNNATSMPSLMHIAPQTSTTLSSTNTTAAAAAAASTTHSSANINMNVNNLMNGATFAATGNPPHLATAMTMSNNSNNNNSGSRNSNGLTSNSSNNGIATGILTTAPIASQLLNQKIPHNYYGNHNISNLPLNGTNGSQRAIHTNATTTLTNAESIHNNATPVVFATSPATMDANTTNAVSDVKTTTATTTTTAAAAMSTSSATSTTATSTNDNTHTEKKSESNEDRIANAKNLLYDAYMKALG